MILKKIQIKRFRFILNLNTSNIFLTICGANNSGKTNALKALNIFFNPKQYSLTEDIPKHKLGLRAGSTYLEIILTFVKGNFKHAFGHMNQV
jgi:predicted ATP-dependent endonuclease of OLD family